MAAAGAFSSALADVTPGPFVCTATPLACHGCLKALGFRNRVQLIPAEKRAAYHLPRLLARLTAPPARLHPRPGRTLDRRPRLERSLRRSLIVERQHALEEHDEMLKR